MTVPTTVTKIGTAAFYACAKLNSVTVKGSVAEIGDVVCNACASDMKVYVTAGSAFAQYAADNGYTIG